MKIKFGALVVAGSGKIGGQVVARNAAGSYLRTKVTPTNPKTADQVAARARLGANAQAWGGLTQAQRDAFNSASSEFTSKNVFGDNMKLSGINVFSRLNNNLLMIGESIISAPPVSASLQGSTTVEVISTATGSVLTLESDVATPAGAKAVIRMTAPQSAGKKFVKSEFRNISVGAFVASTPLDVSAEYIAKFGALPLAGQKVFGEIFIVSSTTGIASQRVSNSAITGA